LSLLKKRGNGTWQDLGSYGIFSNYGFQYNPSNNGIYIPGTCWSYNAGITYTTNGGLNWNIEDFQVIGSVQTMLLGSKNYAAGGSAPGGSSSTFHSSIWKEDAGVWSVDTVLADENTQVLGFSKLCKADNVIYAVGADGIIMKKIEDTPLPVELSSFIATVNQNSVILSWSTSSEINNARFEVERKTQDGNWNKITEIAGNGTSGETHVYTFHDYRLNSGSYNYRLKQIDFNGNYEYFNLHQEIVIAVPEKFSLSQNYPNPFNPVTLINFSIPQTGIVILTVHDVSGREVIKLLNEKKDAGTYSIQFDGAGLNSGIYFYTLQTGNTKETKKMILIK
jgi:hypothetical protein